MYHIQSRHASDLKACAQRAAAGIKTVEDTLPSKGLLVDQSADCRTGGKGDFNVDRKCYYRSAVEWGYECYSRVLYYYVNIIRCDNAKDQRKDYKSYTRTRHLSTLVSGKRTNKTFTGVIPLYTELSGFSQRSKEHIRCTETFAPTKPLFWSNPPIYTPSISFSSHPSPITS